MSSRPWTVMSTTDAVEKWGKGKKKNSIEICDRQMQYSRVQESSSALWTARRWLEGWKVGRLEVEGSALGLAMACRWEVLWRPICVRQSNFSISLRSNAKQKRLASTN